MSTHTKAQLIAGLKAGADLSSSQYKAVKLDASGDVVVAGAGEQAIGILQNAPESGETCDVAMIGGGALGTAGGTINEGDFLKSDASGDLVATTTATDFVCARAIKSAADGDIFHVLPMQLFHG